MNVAGIKTEWPHKDSEQRGGDNLQPMGPFVPSDGKNSKAPLLSRRKANVRELAARFALTVTDSTSVEESFVAKNGNESLFAVFAEMIPEVSDLTTDLAL